MPSLASDGLGNARSQGPPDACSRRSMTPDTPISRPLTLDHPAFDATADFVNRATAGDIPIKCALCFLAD